MLERRGRIRMTLSRKWANSGEERTMSKKGIGARAALLCGLLALATPRTALGTEQSELVLHRRSVRHLE